MKRRVGIVDAMTSAKLFGPYFKGTSWNGWRSILRGAFALPMTEPEREFFRQVTGRSPPTKRVRELWCVVGRRGGKDSIASLIAAHSAAMFSGSDRLRPGESALVLALACDRDQAKIVLNYVRAYFNDVPALKGMVRRETTNGFELSNAVDVAVGTNSFRSVRGRPILCAVLDECAFYRDEDSASPDEETYRALRPGMATLADDALLIGISSPYRRSGLLYRKFAQHYGKDGDVLVVRAPSRTLNPTLPQSLIEEALAEDPAAAAAEWLAEFRTDIESFVSRAAVENAVVVGRHELPPTPGISYVAFCDPSGGSADSFTVAIAHHDSKSGKAVLDALREVRPPFSPDAVTAEFATLIKNYGISKVYGDRYAGEWPRERFAVHGVPYKPSEQTKSDYYIGTLPLLNSNRVELLDHPRLVSQLCGLERRTSRAGKDSIDHAPGGHDDVANSVCGSLVIASGSLNAAEVWARFARNTPVSIAPTNGFPRSAIVFSQERRGF